MNETSTDQNEAVNRDGDGDTQEKLESLAQAFAVFTKTTDYLNSILDSMSDGVVVLDSTRTITTFNRAAEDVLGIEPVEATGQSCDDLLGASLELMTNYKR